MIPFTGSPLDRRSDKRGDTAWLAEELKTARILPLFQGQVLVTGSPELKAAWVTLEACAGRASAGAPLVFLGKDEEISYFALEVFRAEGFSAAGEFQDLRTASLTLKFKDLAILSQAKGMLEWHARNGFCPRCGAKTAIADAGTKRVCPLCATEHFPRTDPAVIMLATHNERCLLARNVNWAPDFYSCLAGFMEPGESVEEAVRRELHEEAGVVAGTVRYLASQPWPFPAALMMACYAEVDSDALTLDHTEIADAMWLTRAEARALLNGKIEGRRGPITSAVAWYLIDGWARG